MAFLSEKGRRVVYQGVNKQGNIYTISFYSKSIKEGKDTIYPKPNVITDIEVYLGAAAFFKLVILVNISLIYSRNVLLKTYINFINHSIISI